MLKRVFSFIARLALAGDQISVLLLCPCGSGATLRAYRYDQIMRLGWKVFIR